MRLLLALSFAVLTLSSCAVLPEAAKGARQLITSVEPEPGAGLEQRMVYCYQTLGKPDCYYEPQKGTAANRMIGMQPSVSMQPMNPGTAMPDGSIMNQPAQQLPVVSASPAPTKKNGPVRMNGVPDIITSSTVEMHADQKPATPATAKKRAVTPRKTFDGSGEAESSSSNWADKPL